ncbi:MAG: 8-oxo-dGTP diphosphatase [Bacillota bacterium]|nr:8-oxo-dGTP diphosphatase [Bacillota bacterium]
MHLRTTLCYMYRDDCVLMLYRNKKKNDVNAGKWIGVGGKVEEGETPDRAVLREIREETGYDAHHCDFRGIIVFNYNDNPSEYMHLYTTDDFSGEMKECDEGTLKWIKREDVMQLSLWEGDRIFLELLEKNAGFFHLTLYYHNDTLLGHELRMEDSVRFE